MALAKSGDFAETLRSAEKVGPLPTVGITLEQKPVSVLHLDEYRLFDGDHHS